MSFFSSSKKVTLGLHIENDSVKMVKLRHTRQGPELMGFAVAELPRDGRDSREIKKSKISSAIEEILAKEKIKKGQIILSIGGRSVHVQLARLPSLPGEKLKEAVKWMIKEKAPFDLKETTLDYFVLDKVRDNGTEKLEMVAVVAKNKVIQEKMNLLKGAALKPTAVNVVPLALLNSFKVTVKWKKDEVIVLVDVEASATHLAIVKNAKLAFNREIAFGGDTITEGLKERLSLSDLESAQKVRERYGILDEDSDEATEKGKVEINEEKEKAFKISEAIKVELGKLVSELRLSFNSYRAQSLEDRIDRIVLSGSLTQLKNLDKFLAATLRIPVKVANLLDEIPLAPQFEKKKYHKPPLLSVSLNIAAGLALGKGEGINLSPAKEKSARLARQVRTILFPSLYFLILFFLLTTGNNFLIQKAAVYEQELQSKKAKIISLQPGLDKVETLMRALNRWNERYASIMQLKKSSIPWIPVLDQFSEAIPKRAWLRELSLGTSLPGTNQKKDSSILIIKGSIKWEKLVADLSLIEFIRKLEKSPYLNDVYLQSTDRNSRYGQEVIDFTITTCLLPSEEIALSRVQPDGRVERSGSS